MRRYQGFDDRGAALVELVIVLPLLIMIVFGIVEFGAAWNNRLKVEAAARAGARVGSGLGTARLADYSVLQNVKAALADFGIPNVDYVVVFKANATNGSMPSGCSGPTPTSQFGMCNVYTGAQLESLDSDDFAGTATSCSTTAPDWSWCPTTRANIQHLGTDYLGVWIKARSNTVTNLFGSPLGLQSAAIMRLEPR